jgi:hypothetical protein
VDTFSEFVFNVMDVITYHVKQSTFLVNLSMVIDIQNL